MKHFSILFSCALILLFVGCGGDGRPDGMPALHATALTFTQGNTPLADASVTLSPDDASLSQWSIGGVTNNRGVVTIQTNGFNGAPAGTFRITVNKTETEGEAAPRTEPVDNDAPFVETSNIRSFQVVAAEHRSLATTQLTVEITPGRNAQTIDLGPAVREEIAASRGD